MLIFESSWLADHVITGLSLLSLVECVGHYTYTESVEQLSRLSQPVCYVSCNESCSFSEILLEFDYFTFSYSESKFLKV